MLARLPPAIAAMATNTAVQVAWLDRAFRPIEMPSIAEPEQKIQTVRRQTRFTFHPGVSLTENKGSGHDDSSRFAENFLANIVDAVYGGMFALEDAHHVVGPGSNATDDQQADQARNHPKDIEGDGNG